MNITMRTLILVILSLFIFACSSTQPPAMAIAGQTQFSEIKQVANNNTLSRSSTHYSAASSTPKTALVLGNSDYKLMPLVNPENDATDIAAKLKSMGFEVIFAINKNKLDTKKLIRKFGKTLQQRGGVGIFFYAGHGLQIDGINYLVPTNFNVTAAYEVSDAAIDIGLITGAMEAAANPLNIIVLDACRNNPYPRKSRSSSRGLARISSASGTLIAYSTSPGNVADDGKGRNSPYTQFLLKHMDTQGITIEQVFKRVRVDVRHATRGKQLPWETSSLTGDFYFKRGEQIPAAYIPPPQPVQATVQPIQATPKPQAQPSVKPPSISSTRSEAAKKLSIFTNPAESTVNILNSDVSYSRGVLLEPGSYQISVSKAGFMTKKKWIVIDKSDVDIQITLVPDY